MGSITGPALSLPDLVATDADNDASASRSRGTRRPARRP